MHMPVTYIHTILSWTCLYSSIHICICLIHYRIWSHIPIFSSQWETTDCIFMWTRNMDPVLCHRSNKKKNSKIVFYPLIHKWPKSINLQSSICYLFLVNLKIHACMICNWITLGCNCNSLHPPKHAVSSLARIMCSLCFNCSLYSCI